MAWRCADLLVNELHHSRGLGQPTGTNRPTKTLTRLSPAGPIAVQSDWKCPGTMDRWVPNWVLQIDPASRCSMLTRARSWRSKRSSCSSCAERITSAASEPKATKAAPRAAWRGEELPGSESVQNSLLRDSIPLSASLLRASYDLDRCQIVAGRRCCVATSAAPPDATTRAPLTARNIRSWSKSRAMPNAEPATICTLALIKSVSSSKTVDLSASSLAVVSGQKGLRSTVRCQIPPCW